MRQLIYALSLLAVSQTALAIRAIDRDEIPLDSLETRQLEEVQVYAQTPLIRESSELWRVPGGVTMITPTVMREFHLHNLTDLTALVPGLYIPDYGSSSNAPIYFRGIGSRSGSAATSLYIDGVPTLTQTLKKDILDAASIRVMSASQSSTYGRNSMAGNIHVRTVSPFEKQGLEVLLRGGSYMTGRGQAIYRTLLSSEWGLTVGGYVQYLGGYYTNQYDGKKSDHSLSGGGTVRSEWRRGPHTLILSANADGVDQGAFPYAPKDPETGKVMAPNINRPGTYKRFSTQERLSYTYAGDEADLHINGGVEYLHGKIHMDQDYSPADVFSVNQREKQLATTLEVALKSKRDERFHWTTGISGFYLHSDHHSPVEIYPDGLQKLVQPQLNRAMAMMAKKGIKMPGKLLADTEMALNNNQSWKKDCGVAAYLEGSIADFVIPRLTLTAGLRVDLEHQGFDYDSDFASRVIMEMNRGGKTMRMPQPIGGRVKDHGFQTFLVALPKLALSYDLTDDFNAFITVSRGYKTGGYSDQVMTQTAMQAAFASLMPKPGTKPGRPAPIDVDNLPIMPSDPKAAAYDPEYGINYEVGFRARLFDDRLLLTTTVFDTRITNQQITRFVTTSAGRYVDNAGQSRSTGVEATAAWQIIPSLRASVSYGHADSRFEVWHTKVTKPSGERVEVDLAGNYVPYMPQHTASALLSYHKGLDHKVFRAVHASAEYSGVGPIYRDPENTVREDFYSLLGARAGVQLGLVDVTLWGRNLLNTEYHPFYFSFFGQDLFQKGAPLTFGVDLMIRM